MKQAFLIIVLFQIVCFFVLASCANMKGLSLKESIHVEKGNVSGKFEMVEEI